MHEREHNQHRISRGETHSTSAVRANSDGKRAGQQPVVAGLHGWLGMTGRPVFSSIVTAFLPESCNSPVRIRCKSRFCRTRNESLGALHNSLPSSLCSV